MKINFAVNLFSLENCSICNAFKFYVLKGGFWCVYIYNYFDNSYYYQSRWYPALLKLLFSIVRNKKSRFSLNKKENKKQTFFQETFWNTRLKYCSSSNTAWKVSKQGVFSGPYFHVFGHLSRSESFTFLRIIPCHKITLIISEKYFFVIYLTKLLVTSQPACNCSQLTIETLEKGVKYVQS